MYKEEFELLCTMSDKKLGFLNKTKFGYLVSGALSGMFVGFGVLIYCSLGVLLGNVTYAKLVMGLAFSLALVFVMFAGGDLFTSNCMVMSGAYFRKRVSAKDMLKVLFFCYLGNLIGSLLLSVGILGTGIAKPEFVNYLLQYGDGKISLGYFQMFVKGIFCNIIVSMACWACYKNKCEITKFFIILISIFSFIILGFEHCIANMTTFILHFILSGDTNNLMGYLSNLIFVTLGNFIGGAVFVALPYHILSKDLD